MLVLDEQLLGRHLEAALGRWYRGPVRVITDLRPGTVIKDEAIPVLVGSKNSNAPLPQRLWTRHRLLLALISL